MGVKEGGKAPGFSEQDAMSASQFLLPHLGKSNVVLYFYPRDDTPGCTREAEGFRDAHARFQGLSTVIIGVSKDSISSHENFRKKHELPFDLIADTDAQLAIAYGVWVEKSMFGKSYMGIERSTFLIDKDGIVRKAWRNVKVSGHVEEVLGTLAEI
ncbi:peroxiredoxin [Anaplasma platys]|nr:peroxiredoxin [Anaplasma platys]